MPDKRENKKQKASGVRLIRTGFFIAGLAALLQLIDPTSVSPDPRMLAVNAFLSAGTLLFGTIGVGCLLIGLASTLEDDE